MTRIEKTRAIGDWDIAQDYLDVCFHFNNCGTCAKCYRTLVTLDLLGKVDDFGRVFDIKKYYRNRKKAYGWLLYTKQGDAKNDNAVFARDIYRLAKEKRLHFPLASYGYMLFLAGRSVLVKLYHFVR